MSTFSEDIGKIQCTLSFLESYYRQQTLSKENQEYLCLPLQKPQYIKIKNKKIEHKIRNLNEINSIRYIDI